MLKDLNRASSDIGLKLNSHKTKWVDVGALEDTFVGNRLIGKVEDYVYLGHKIELCRELLDGEIDRRIQFAWAAFGKIDHVFRATSRSV